jgi:hypothetical protein
MYDWLLFLHVLAAFALFVAIVGYSAFVLGGPPSAGTVRVANIAWDAGGLGTLVLGVWLALYLDQYEITNGWILGALGLWLVATGLGSQSRLAPGDLDAGALTSRFAAWHWVRVIAVLALLAVMVWKPGA